MAEEGLSNVEVAHHLHGHRGAHGAGDRTERRLQILEAVLLAIVAIATAWSGYQAARWNGRQAELYGVSSRQRLHASLSGTLGGQNRLYDTTTFNAWLQAASSGNERAAQIFRRRFRAEYVPAFEAWLRTHPFTNPKAPKGPVYMPQYRNAALARSAVQDREATATFDAGTTARDRGESYIRLTVLLAVVLFLAALAQRFTLTRVRVGLLCVGGALLVFALVSLLTSPTIF